MTLTFHFSVDYDEAVGDHVSQEIRAQKHRTAPEYFYANGDIVGREGVNITLRDADATLIGALIGSTFFNGLHVHWIWVDKAHRHNGYAREMLNRAIAIARERHCTFAWWETWTLLGAYTMFEKLGAKVIMRMDDYPPGSSLIRYRLDFD